MTMASKIHKSSGNVFRDVGFPPDEAENLRLRAELIVHILRLIEKSSLTQAAAAKLFGVTQPRISDLTRGRIALFSIDGLVKMLAHAGAEVSLVVKPGRQVA